MEGEALRFPRQGIYHSTVVREICLLCDDCPFPYETRGDEKVDIEVVTIMTVDEPGVTYMTLEAAAHTAPVTAVAGGIEPVGTREQRCEIADHRCLGVLLSEDMVIESPFIVRCYPFALRCITDIP